MAGFKGTQWLVCCLVTEHIRTGRIKTRIKLSVVDMTSQSFTIENILRCTTPPTRASGPFISTPNRSEYHSNLQQAQCAHTSFSDDSAIDLRLDSKKSTEVFSNITTSELPPDTLPQSNDDSMLVYNDLHTSNKGACENEGSIISTDDSSYIFNPKPATAREMVLVS